jgi:hypothetical protein
MPDKETLQRIVSDPHSSEEERSEAQHLLSAEPADEPELHLTGIDRIGTSERDLLLFAGASRLADVTPYGAMEFVNTQLQPLCESVRVLLKLWYVMRWPTAEVWEDAKQWYPDTARTEFERIIAAHPYLGDDFSTVWREFQHLSGLCSQNDDYTVRTYFLSRVEELLNRLPEYAFELREAVQALLARYKT